MSRSVAHRPCKLIMTLLVRNEEDIVRCNIDFHLKHGVDFIIATDNGSTDGTAAVLKEYEKKGLLHLIEEPSHDHNQAAWNNRMAKIAREKYGADVIFHCDADEFWHPLSGNLKDEISERPEDILKVDVINVLLTDRGGTESFPDDTRYAVINPVIASNYWEETRHQNLFYFKYPQKVMFKADKHLFRVVQGNHEVENKGDSIKEGVSGNTVIYHYPVRNKARFTEKTVFGGVAYESANTHLPEDGLHKRRWYAAYKEGRLDDEYRKLLLRQEDIANLQKEGFIEEVDFDEIILGKEIHPHRWTCHHRLFEYETIFDDLSFPWAGHKYFAYDLVRNIKPQIVVDLRSDMGSSFLSFCQAVKDGRLKARLYCIDAGAGHEAGALHNGVKPAALSFPRRRESGIFNCPPDFRLRGNNEEKEYYTGLDAMGADRRTALENIQDGKDKYCRGINIEILPMTAQEAVARFQDGSIDLLNTDGFQTFEETKRCIDAWLPKVKPDGMILIHDIFTKNNDCRVYQYWEELKKEYCTIEFHHSYGLGVVCLSEKMYEDFMHRERDWQMEYASRAFDKQCQALKAPLEHFRETLVAYFKNKMAERDQALALVDEMKASKSWKMTAPMRSMAHVLRHKVFSVKNRLKTK